MSATGKAKIGVDSSWFAEDLNQTSTPDETPTPEIPVVRTLEDPPEILVVRTVEDPPEIPVVRTLEDPPKIPVVRRLKDPPEIWELVPVPPSQPRSGPAFITRFASSRSMFILVVIAIICVGGYLGVRNGKRVAGTRTAPVEAGTKVDSRKAGVAVDKKSIQESNVPAPVATSSVNQTTVVVESASPKRKASPRSSKPIAAVTEVSNRAAASESVSPAEGSEVSQPSDQKTRPLANTTETTGTSSVDSESSRKSKTSVSPQLIDSPKSSDSPKTSTPPKKSKVIQWP